MRKIIRRVPATTNNIQRAIINFLNDKGHFAFRVNNGAVFDPVKKVFRKRSKNDPAIADVHATLYPSGCALWVEVKNAETGDRASSEQKKFAENIKRRGGYHYFAKTYPGFLSCYDEHIYDGREL
jgi:hypothetical protein